MDEKILIVDDSIIMRGVLRKTFGMIGYLNDIIFEAANGSEALRILEKENFGLIVTDLNMPVMSGFELIAHLKESKFSKIPILIVSTEGSETKMEKLLQFPGVEFLRKPFKPEVLLKKIQGLEESNAR